MDTDSPCYGTKGLTGPRWSIPRPGMHGEYGSRICRSGHRQGSQGSTGHDALAVSSPEPEFTRSATTATLRLPELANTYGPRHDTTQFVTHTSPTSMPVRSTLTAQRPQSETTHLDRQQRSTYTTHQTSYTPAADQGCGESSRRHHGMGTGPAPVLPGALPPRAYGHTSLQHFDKSSHHRKAPGFTSGGKIPCCAGCAGGKGCDGKTDCTLCKLMQTTSAEGTNQLQSLNCRLVTLLQTTKHQQMDLSVFAELQEVIRELKDESVLTSERYQVEIRRLNGMLEKRSNEESQVEGKVIFLEDKVKTFKDDLRSWKEKYGGMETELRESEDKRTELVKEKADLDKNIRWLEFELEQLKRETDENKGGNLTIIHSQTKVELTESNKRITLLEDQLRRQTNLHDDEKGDWQRKISNFQKIITSLEEKIRELTQTERTKTIDIRPILDQLKAMFQSEIDASQQQTTSAIQGALEDINSHMDRSVSDADIDANPKYRDMVDKCGQYKMRMTEYENQAQGYKGQLADLHTELDRERAAFQAKVNELEQRLAEFYRQYIDKTQECSMARHGQMALQGEISALRAIVEAEESKGK